MTASKRYPWLVVALLWVVALLNYMDRQMLSTMRPSMQVDIAALQQAACFGNLMAIFLWVYGMMSPFSGMIADRINRKWIIVVSLGVWSAVTAAMGSADNFDQLYWLRAAMGVSEALYIPAALSLIADYHPGPTRSLAIGIHMTGIYAGQALGGFGATIASSFSWQDTFRTFGIVGVFYALLLVFFLAEFRKAKVPLSSSVEGKRSDNPGSSIHSLLLNPSFWVLLFYFMVPSLPGWGVKNWLPTLFAQNLHIDMTVAGPLSTITIALSSFLGVLLGGILSDRWVKFNLRGRVYVSAIGLFLTVPSLVFIGLGHQLIFVLAAACCFGIGYGMFDANNMPILCQLVPENRRATGYGLMNMMGVFAGAFITDLLGKSTDAGHLGRDFSIMGAIVLVAISVQLLALRPKTQNFTD